MTDIEIRRANVRDAAEAAFDAHRAVDITAEMADGAEELVGLSTGLPSRGVGRTVALLRSSSKACRTAASQVQVVAGEMSSLLGEFVAHAGRPGATAYSIHQRFQRATSRRDEALDRAVSAFARVARLAAGLALLHGPAEDENRLWDGAVAALSRLGLPPDAVPQQLSDDATLEVFLAGLAAHVALHAPALAVVRVDSTENRFVRFVVRGGGEAEIESVGDTSLGRADRLRKADIAVLRRLGFTPPEGTRSNWHLDLHDATISNIGEVVAEVLRKVHRFTPPARLLLETME